MEAKKSPKANLETKTFWFLQIGLIIALGLSLVAFEWRTYDLKQADIDLRKAEIVQDEIIDITQPLKPAPPVVQTPPPLTTVLKEVINSTEITSEIRVDAENPEMLPIPPVVFSDLKPVAPEKPVVEDEIISIPEVQPSFPGGDKARIEWLQKNIVYPQLASETGIQGTVFLTFVVEKDGSITDVKVMRGIGGGCDEEAVRAVQSMPKWNPGKQGIRTVRTQFSMPVKFALAN